MGSTFMAGMGLMGSPFMAAARAAASPLHVCKCVALHFFWEVTYLRAKSIAVVKVDIVKTSQAPIVNCI